MTMHSGNMTFADIRDILPHRFPISMVDRVLEMKPGQSLTAVKCVTGNEPCFMLLRDGTPYERCFYPQSLLIESFLQAAGLLFIYSVEFSCAPSDSVMLFGSISNCEFSGSALPGDRVEHRVRTERLLSDSAILTGESLVDGLVIARFGQAVVAIRPKAALETEKPS